MAPSFPRPFGKYTLLRALEAGATGDVFLAHSDELGFNELCVIKRLGAEDHPATEEQVARARRALPLSHESLVSVTDIGAENGQVFTTMEFIEGRDLRDVLVACAAKEAALPIEAGLFIGIQICKGLRLLHESGRYEALRRVVDPANVLLSFDGDVKLGMARTRDPDRVGGLQLEYTGLAYLSPEELADEPLDGQSDVFSLGMLLWDVLVGQPLHTGLVGRAAALEAALQAATLRPSSYNPDLDDELDALVMRALAPKPADRHPNVEELRADLASALVSREPGFDGAAVADLLGQIYGDEVVHARRESRRLLARAERVSKAAKAATVEVDRQQAALALAVDTDTDLVAIDTDPLSAEQLEGDNLAGQTIGHRYRIQRRIGEGGMGAVYLAEHIDIGRQVAVKVLHAAYSNDQELVKRFRQEARAAAEIGHPNIIEVTDFGTTVDGRIYFVMEYLAGEDLAQVMAKTRRLPIDRSLRITLQICEALHAAHEAGIVHRDLKPENVFLVEKDGKPDFVKILDFGVAINLETVRRGDARLTTPGMAMGTPEYMSPEQAAGQSVDRRIDVYATAVMVFEMITGRLPHEGPTLMALLNKKATEPPTKPSRYRAELPQELEDTLLRGLERDPEQRFQTMEELRTALSEGMLNTTGPHRAPAALISGERAPVATPGAQDASVPVASEPAQLPTLADGRPATTPSGRHPLDEVITGPNSAPPPGNTALLGATVTPGANPFDATAYPETPTLGRRRSPLGMILVLALLFGGAGFGIWWWQSGRSQAVQPPAPDVVTIAPDLSVPKKKPKKKRKKIKKPKPKPKKLTAAEVKLHLEWAKRAAYGHRYTRPRGDNVRDLLRKIERDHPEHPGVKAFRERFCRRRVKRARRDMRRRRTKRKAIARLSTCIAIAPEHERARGLLAHIHLKDAKKSLKRRRYAAALKEGKAALNANPKSISVHEFLGDLAYKRRRYRDAAHLFAKALELERREQIAKLGDKHPKRKPRLTRTGRRLKRKAKRAKRRIPKKRRRRRRGR